MAARAELESQARLSAHLTGKSCTQISLAEGDALILDFGDLHPNPDGQLAGAIVLIIECPWRIDTPELPAVGWEDDEEDVVHLSTVLIGGTVEEVDIRRPGFDLTIILSNGHRLRVFPDCRAYYLDEMSGGAIPWQLTGRDVAAESHIPDSPF